MDVKSDRDKVRHLLRRFGLGANRTELNQYAALGYKKAVETLLNDDKLDEGFPISPWEFGAQLDGNLDSGAYHVAGWWALRLMMTKRPLQERLTLFWHDHFALDAEKVYELPIMAGYLETLRTYGRGRFRDLLQAVFKQGALFIYLDNQASNRIHPNENFARELFELFTLGIGNYTEKDVLESARAFTGWSTHYLGTGFNTEYNQLRLLASKNDLAMNNVCYVPAIHDAGDKTIFGVTKKWTAEDVLDAVADHPKTIRYISQKLWEWFAYPNPPETVLAKMERTWKSTKGEIRALLKTIVDCPEFWSAENLGTKPKSPIETTVSLYRTFDLADVVLKLRGAPKTQYDPIPKPVRDTAGGLFYLMQRQGFRLLYPPNVAGWDWGLAWINTASSMERLNLANTFWGGGAERPFAVIVANRLKNEDKAETPEQIVDGLADILDVPIDAATRPILVEACTKYGGRKALDNKDQSANLFARLSRLLYGTPAGQLY